MGLLSLTLPFFLLSFLFFILRNGILERSDNSSFEEASFLVIAFIPFPFLLPGPDASETMMTL
jgi:hypothetical protein